MCKVMPRSKVNVCDRMYVRMERVFSEKKKIVNCSQSLANQLKQRDAECIRVYRNILVSTSQLSERESSIWTQAMSDVKETLLSKIDLKAKMKHTCS